MADVYVNDDGKNVAKVNISDVIVLIEQLPDMVDRVIDACGKSKSQFKAVKRRFKKENNGAKINITKEMYENNIDNYVEFLRLNRDKYCELSKFMINIIAQNDPRGNELICIAELYDQLDKCFDVDVHAQNLINMLEFFYCEGELPTPNNNNNNN